MMWFKINSPKVIFETYETEIVLINLENGNYYSLSGIASEIFSLIQNEIPKDEIIDQIIRKFQSNREEIIIYLDNFFKDLLMEGLIIFGEKNIEKFQLQEAVTFKKAVNPDKLPFDVPLLNKYSDMQDLLLLDPVHEIDETGWPNFTTPDPDPEQ